MVGLTTAYVQNLVFTTEKKSVHVDPPTSIVQALKTELK